MSRYVDGAPFPANLFEAAAWQKAVRVTCRCGHSATFNPHGLWWRFERNGWDMRFPEMRRRFSCTHCQGNIRPLRIEPVSDPAEITLPMPPEREWKQALRRFR